MRGSKAERFDSTKGRDLTSGSGAVAFFFLLIFEIFDLCLLLSFE